MPNEINGIKYEPVDAGEYNSVFDKHVGFRILNGDFFGLVFVFTNVSAEEKDGELYVDLDYLILRKPRDMMEDTFDESNPEFIDTVNSIFEDMIDQYLLDHENNEEEGVDDTENDNTESSDQ